MAIIKNESSIICNNPDSFFRLMRGRFFFHLSQMRNVFQKTYSTLDHDIFHRLIALLLKYSCIRDGDMHAGALIISRHYLNNLLKIKHLFYRRKVIQLPNNH